MEGVALENPLIRSLSSTGYDIMDVDSVPDEESGSKKEDLSLRLTESDSDDEPLMPRVTKTFKRNKAVVDSDDEQLSIALPAETNNEVSSCSEDDQLFGITTKSHRRILQNDSDNENNIVVPSKKKSYEELPSNNENNPTDSDDDELPIAKLKKNKGVDSSSGKKKRSKNSLPSWINSDDSNTTVDTAENEDSNQTKNSSHKNSKMSEGPDWKSKLSSDLFSNDESSSNEEGYSLEEIKSKAKKKWKMAEDSSLSEPKAEKSRKSKSKATTPKVTKEETQKIHSESQRMVRESAVSLPYHKPKQRSLTEFLNRKRVPTNPGRSLKPSLKDLDAVAQVLEDRAKEVETFFKSESEESEAEENPKSEPSPAVVEKQPFDTAEAPVELNSIEQLPTETSETITGLSATAGTSECSENLSQLLQTEEKPEEKSADRVEKPRIIIEDPPEEIESIISPMKTLVEMDKLESSPDLSHSVTMDHKERLANLKRMSIASVPKPSLHGRPGQIIDLNDDGDDTGSKAGVNNLIERFVEQVSSLKKSPRKKDVQLSIVKKVVSAAGQVELKKDVITVSADEKHDPDSAISSGRRRQLVKDALRQSIEAKRAAERAKRQQEQRIDNEEDGEGDGESEKEEEILSDEPETDEDDMGDDEEDEDEDSTSKKLKKKKKKKEKSLFLDEEADVSGEDDLADGSDDDTTNDVPVIEEPNLDRCDEDDSLDGASTVVGRTTSMSSAKGTFGLSATASSTVNNLSLSPNLDVRTNNPSHGLFSSSWQPGSSQDNMDELIGLCSGRFAPGEEKIEAGVSRSLFGHSQANDDVEEEEDEEEKGFMRILPAEDEDEDEAGPSLSLNDETEAQVRAVAILSDDEDDGKDRSKRKKAKFFISDDEDDEDEPKSKTDRHRADEDEDEEEEMHEEEKEFRGIGDFLDKEAELSGSELGSGDENEDGEDDWEEEDGDKEVFDDTQVRDQLGRAHLKTMLDQDQREVRLFQELFLEDGDLHTDGGGRQRQFRWKDAGADEDSQRPAGQKDDDVEDDSVEVEQDSAWRKMRQEREKWLQEQKAKQETVVTDESDPPLLKRNVRVVRVNSFSKAAANQSTAKAEPAAGTNQQQKILSPKKPLANTMVKRGSFLRRSDKDLSTIASLTKSVLPVQTARTGSNFVFASLTPERPAASAAGKTNENRKQKQMDSKEATNPPAKKAKTTGASKSIFSFFQ